MHYARNEGCKIKVPSSEYATKDEASDDNHCFELHINRHSMLF